jgi:hypothetical protein
MAIQDDTDQGVEKNDLCAEIIHQPIPDMAGTEPRLNRDEPDGLMPLENARRYLDILRGKFHMEHLDGSLGSTRQVAALAYSCAIAKAVAEIDRLRANLARLVRAEEAYTANERLALRRLSDALTAGAAGTWDEVFDAAELIGSVSVVEGEASASTSRSASAKEPSTDQGAAVELIRDRIVEGWRFGDDEARQRLRSDLDALITAALAQGRAETQGWQPIETAPKDRRWLLGWHEDFGHFVFRDGPGLVTGEDPMPTHWMSLPPPPPLVVGEREEPQKTDGAALLPVDPSAEVKTEPLPTCGLCGEPMPAGEEMFNYHGYSGPCPEKAGENGR